MVARGQAIVELAIAFPVLCLLLLGIVGAGFYYLEGERQSASTGTLAAWMGANPDASAEDLAAYAARVTTCDWTSETADNLVTVTITCPGLPLLPVFPENIVTTAEAFTQ